MNIYYAAKLLISMAKTAEKLTEISEKLAMIYFLDESVLSSDEYSELVNLINEKKEKLQSTEV